MRSLAQGSSPFDSETYLKANKKYIVSLKIKMKLERKTSVIDEQERFLGSIVSWSLHT